MSATAKRRRKKAANPRVDEKRLKHAEWLRKYRAALEAYNEHVERHGVFSEGLRSF